MEELSGKKRIKVIDLDDKFVDYKYNYPYYQCIHSKVRFFLRSKLTYNHNPVILIENDNHFDPILPLKIQVELNSSWIEDNFRILKGKYNADGAWMADLDCNFSGLINFQVVFQSMSGEKKITRTGTCDTIMVMQDKIDVRFLRKLTVFPRCIGHYTKWVPFFKKQIELGYNSFHLAPIQQTGMSKSYYSIYNQLELSSDVFDGTPQQKIEQLKTIVKKINQIGGTFFIDIVLNHTSFDSYWIKSQPNSVYTIENTPHLTSAFEVDKVIYEWGKQIKEVLGPLGSEMTVQQFNAHHQKLQKLIKQMKLEEYFQLAKGVMEELIEKVPPSVPSENLFAKDPIDIIQQFITENSKDIGSSRRGITVDNIKTVWKQLQLGYQRSDMEKAVNNFNNKWLKKIQDCWVPQIINNVMAQVKRNYLDDKKRSYGDYEPFVKNYFTEIVTGKGRNFYALNNGWVGGHDTAQANFIYSKQYYYFRRRVFVWGDLVRIRYGEKPSDAPYSWTHIQKYIASMASIFDGFRMDNLHGTQLHVARHMAKKARQVNPNIIIFAQLFTDTDQEKAMFVRTIGINSTLVEGQRMANGKDFVRNFHELMGQSGPYIGSLKPYFQKQGTQIKHCKRKRPLLLVYDLTHDNKTYFQKQIHIKQLPMTMLISLMGTFIGSTKGYDQFYSKKILVIEQKPIYSQDRHQNPQVDRSNILQKRFIFGQKEGFVYGSWDNWKEPVVLHYDAYAEKCWADLELPSEKPGKYEYKFKSQGNWLTEDKYFVNERGNHVFYLPDQTQRTIYTNLEGFRKCCAKYANDFSSFRQYYIYNDNDIVMLFRQTRNHQQAICIIVNLSTKEESLKKPIVLPGRYQNCQVWYQTNYAVSKGQYQMEVQIVHHQNIYQFFELASEGPDHKDILIGTVLPPGFACIIRTRKDKQVLELIYSASQILNQPLRLPPLGPLDINLILFGTAREEQLRFGQSNYVIPGCKQLVYGGFGGVYQQLCFAKKQNKLTLPIFNNLREGNWLLKYYVERIKRFKYLTEVADIVDRYFSIIQQLPRELIPSYFTDFIYKFWRTIKSQFGNDRASFQSKLLLASTQFISSFPSQQPLFRTTFAAGLPHFAIGWSRCWGRDTFISNQILLNHPNIYRQIIIQFASALRHGTIPNLLDNGKNPRYNCRDSCWWFIRGVKQYANSTGDYSILKSKVDMLFLSNDQQQHNHRKSKGETKVMIIQDIIQQIFQSHAHGISYRQWNAGIEIDSNMSGEGFTINLHVDENTGFIIGGNTFNCLTWMDKMGSSTKAGTKGFPSTPRSGCPVQLVGLLKHCLSAYGNLYDQGKYSYNSVTFKHRQVTFHEWACRIEQVFEMQFYIPDDHGSSQSMNKKNNPAKIKGIYKDVIYSEIQPQENRLRPNALIALALAPELFDQSHALTYLSHVRKYLINQNSIGIATLAPFHQSLYNPSYDNDDDSEVFKISHGFSYHNGPQWVWLYGFYLLAVINFKPIRMNRARALGLLQNHIKYITNDEWCSLPELTDINGEFNRFSCNAQAWSISSMLLAIKQIQNLPK